MKKYRVVGCPGCVVDELADWRVIGHYRWLWTAWLAAKLYTWRGPLSLVYIQTRNSLPQARINKER